MSFQGTKKQSPMQMAAAVLEGKFFREIHVPLVDNPAILWPVRLQVQIHLLFFYVMVWLKILPGKFPLSEKTIITGIRQTPSTRTLRRFS